MQSAIKQIGTIEPNAVYVTACAVLSLVLVLVSALGSGWHAEREVKVVGGHLYLHMQHATC